MKLKTAVLFTTLLAAFTLQAQDVVEPVTVPVPAIEQPVPAVIAPAAITEDAIETIAVPVAPADNGFIKGGLISVSLKEVELSSVIRLFATLSDANIIVPTLEGDAGITKVDVNLKDVEWKPALQSILETQGFELFEKNPGTDVYSVRKKLADAPDPLSVKTFKLNYATVAGVSEMITVMIPAPGKLSIFAARNTIVVQSTPENLAEIQGIISAVDLPRQQVFIEAKFLELSDSASEKIGIDWQVLGGYNIGVSGISGSYNYTDSSVDGINNSYSTGANAYTDIAGRRYENLEENPGDEETDFDARSGNLADDSRIYGITPTTFSETLNGVTSIDSATVAKTLGATLSASDFNLVLAALKETGGTKVVSNPKIIVANEETAQIYIGTKEPNIKQTTTQVQNTDPITTYNLDPDTPYFEYGIKLDVTPTVNTAENISVAIKPSLKRLVSSKEVGGNTYPITSEKTIETLFALESGQTAAIGGLTESDSRDTSRKVPLLGSLPLIGRFFSYSEKSDDQVETIIFVTVGLANPQGINMDTGLPSESSLAMKHTAKMNTDRQIRAEELKIYNQMEAERSQATVQKLQAAEQKRLQKIVDKISGETAE